MDVVKIPRRSFQLDIDGKVFVAKELSVEYLQEAMNNGSDNADLAIVDSMGTIQEDDLKYFGMETKNVVYGEIVKFTFQNVLSKEDITDIVKEFGITEAELNSLDRSTKAQLKAVLLGRKPQDKVAEKKH